MSAAHYGLSNLINLVDVNKQQADGDSRKILGLSYAYTKGDITYIPYIAFKDCPKDAETVIFSLLLDAHKGNRIVLDVARTISEDKKKARQKRLDFFKNAGFTETGISGKDFGVEYDYYALGGKVTREELTEFTEDFWNSLDA